ncbi:MAG: M15 family metallopeptidase [Lachnospiraceae bacterium]|nr:M15 family metallopeptidase [Lachnospiraceae bacterium]
MKGRSYPDTVDESKISFDDLRYVRLKYHNFDGDEVDGEMVVNKAIADDILEIFYELNANDYRLESVRLIDDFDADDELSMEADNTSSFCYRVVAGTDKLSNHALGMAVDINPLYNPYIVYRKNGETVITPIGSEQYVDRDKPFPYKIDREDLCYKLFTEHGFTWGGDWNSSKDYQHFEKK